MNGKYVCPICGGDRNADFSAWLKRMVKRVSFVHNPGGGEVKTSAGHKTQVHLQCGSCDIMRVAMSGPAICPKCGEGTEISQTHRDAIDPTKDEFVCDSCGCVFARLDMASTGRD